MSHFKYPKLMKTNDLCKIMPNLHFKKRFGVGGGRYMNLLFSFSFQIFEKGCSVYILERSKSVKSVGVKGVGGGGPVLKHLCIMLYSWQYSCMFNFYDVKIIVKIAKNRSSRNKIRIRMDHEY